MYNFFVINIVGRRKTMEIEFTKQIPTVKFPSIREYEIKECGEKLVKLDPSEFLIYPFYFFQGVPGAYHDIYVRESVRDMLRQVQKNLPKGVYLKVLDGYRPICVYQRLWNFHVQDLKLKYPEETIETIEKKAAFIVSKPSYDAKSPSLHTTGGAISVTLSLQTGIELNMGTAYRDFSDRAWTNHFEKFEENETIKENRRILYNAMTSAGFTNLPSEWWHYDYGDKFWAFFTGNTSIYGGILDFDAPNRFPLK